jgi:hypothetical protein
MNKERKKDYSESMTGYGGVVERYVYDVCKRLPAAERPDVEKELTASIFESLDGKKDEESVLNVLESFGSPASLADKYRTNPRYLISPANYEMYHKTVTQMMVIVALIFGAIAFTEAYFNIDTGFGGNAESLGDVFFAIARGMAYAFFYTTIVFKVIDEGFFSDTKKWSVNDLPKHVPIKISSVPTDGTGDIIKAIFMLIFLVLIYMRVQDQGTFGFFASQWMEQIMLAFLVFAILTIWRAAVKLRCVEWCKPVRNVVIVTDIAFFTIITYLCVQRDLSAASDEYRDVVYKVQIVFILLFALLAANDIRKTIKYTKMNEKP